MLINGLFFLATLFNRMQSVTMFAGNQAKIAEVY